MTIDWQIWKKPETGGVLVLLVFLTVLLAFLFAKTLINFEINQTSITETFSKTKLLTEQIKVVESFEKLQNQQSQKYSAFKKKKWDQPLTQDSLNNSLYNLQKQTKVDFLFIQPSQNSSPNKLGVTLLVKVLHDQSFFNFLQKLESDLPGIIRVKHFELKRVRELNTNLAQKVSQGEKISLFEGKIELEIDHAQINKQH